MTSITPAGPSDHFKVEVDTVTGKGQLKIGGKLCVVKKGGAEVTDAAKLQEVVAKLQERVKKDAKIKDGQVWKLTADSVQVHKKHLITKKLTYSKLATAKILQSSEKTSRVGSTFFGKSERLPEERSRAASLPASSERRRDSISLDIELVPEETAEVTLEVLPLEQLHSKRKTKEEREVEEAEAVIDQVLEEFTSSDTSSIAASEADDDTFLAGLLEGLEPKKSELEQRYESLVAEALQYRGADNKLDLLLEAAKTILSTVKKEDVDGREKVLGAYCKNLEDALKPLRVTQLTSQFISLLERAKDERALEMKKEDGIRLDAKVDALDLAIGYAEVLKGQLDRFVREKQHDDTASALKQVIKELNDAIGKKE